ncbi:DUF4838 domain-containing protein [bacterium]|nr:DUF4838 domain-containing protein [bacterium]
MKRVSALVIVILTGFVLNGCGSGSGLELARNGTTKYRIVTAAKPSFSTINAAGELKKFMKEMTGADMLIVSDLEPMTGHEIILGNSDHLRQLGVEIDFDKLGKEGYIIRTVGKHLVIAGGELRGNMYGVYGLLEDHLGCRWFTSEVSRIPHYDRLVLPILDETVIPALEYREPFVYEARDGNWAARNRMNRNCNGTLEDRHGGQVQWAPGMFVHTFNILVPPEKYFKQHPEYYSLVGGKRTADYSQLCCTNDEVVAIVTEGVMKAFHDNPQAEVLSVSQNDCFNYCECEKCQALARQEGSQIAPVLQMVNRVAEEVEKRYSGKAIETLAYQWTRKAPKTMRPRPNVIVRLCTIECCFSHPLKTCDSPQNRDFANDLREWSKICDRLWIWNYCTSFSHYFVPFPNLRVRNDNIRFFVENNVKGIFQQDVYTTPHGELSALSGYLNAKLLWNPSYDENTAINEFLDGVYSEAANPIRVYIDMLHDKVERDNIHVGISEGPWADYLTDEILARADSLWNEAEAAVSGKPDVLRRVKIDRLSVDYAIIAHEQNRSAYVIDQDRLAVAVNPAFMERVDRFCRTADDAGVIMLNEPGLTTAQFRAGLEASLKPQSLILINPVKQGATEPGLTRRYYKAGWTGEPDFSKMKADRIDSTSGFVLPEHADWEVFGAGFEGFITVPRDGVYTFLSRSDDGSKLFIGSTEVIDNGGSHPVQERCGFAALKAGTYPIRATYYNSGGGIAFDVLYRTPGGNIEHIPETALSRKKS